MIAYSFLYSPRPGTPAADMIQVDKNKAKDRLVIFKEEANKIKMNYRKNLFNKKSSVLFENRIGNKNQFFGRDKYFNAVIVKSEEDLKGKTREVNVFNGNQNTLFGELIKINNEIYAA